ncbi:hypothetical protein MRB53_014168 [Persea americana]|uniref:Uncharacterized protein n=1 Tax=Persea americana TaxID=3435 RepID=A0ACC2KA55_PERAE|nr:hypothetical protein MRB53_014168 [Persea americana]
MRMPILIRALSVRLRDGRRTGLVTIVRIVLQVLSIVAHVWQQRKWALDEDLGGAWEIGAIVWFLDLFDYYVNNDDQEVFNKELQLDAKVFYFDIGENKRGRFLKVITVI